MQEVSTFRLYLLRATYLLLIVGLGFQIWPGILNPPRDLEHMRGPVRSLLAAVSLLAILGLRYPLKMLPLLFFELVWKSIWVVAIGLPLWFAAGSSRPRDVERLPHGAGAVSPRHSLALRAGQLREGAQR